MAACARLWMTMSANLSSGIAAPTWCKGSNVVVKRVIAFSQSRKLSENELETGISVSNTMNNLKGHGVKKGELTRIPTG